MNYKSILILLTLFACTAYSFRLRQEIDDDNPIHINPGPQPFENKTDPDSPFNPDNNNENNTTDPEQPEQNRTDPIVDPPKPPENNT